MSGYSYVTYAVSGRDYTVTFDYMEQAYVKAEIDGVNKTFTWVNSTTIRLDDLSPTGSYIRIFRQTSPTARLVDWETPGSITDDNLETADQQLFDLVQEAIDSGGDGLRKDPSTQDWDADDQRIINVADPEDDQDAVTKIWAETALTSQLALAEAAAEAAATSETAAEDWAVTPEDTEVPGHAGQFSALHWAAKSQAAVNGVKVSSNDTTPETLGEKLLGTAEQIVVTETNDGGDESLVISVTGNLLALTDVDPAANRLPYFDSATTMAYTALSAYARTLLDDANASDALTTLGASTAGKDILTAASAAAQAALINAGTPCFLAHKNGTAQSGIAASSQVKVTYGTEVIDVGGHYDPGTSRWTPPAGKVRVTAAIYGTAGVVDQADWSLQILKNGIAVPGGSAFVRASGSTDIGVMITALVDVNGTDFIEAYVFATGAGTKTISGNTLYTSFCGEMI